jgi:hypothetical protein
MSVNEGEEKRKERGRAARFWEEGGDKVILSHPTMS